MMRVLFFVALVFLTPLSGHAQDASPTPTLEKIRLQLKWLHQFQSAGFYAAVDQGYYRQAGLEVEIQEAHPHESAVDVVLRGEADYGVHGSDLVVERAKGRPVKALAAIFQHSPMILLARRDRGIDSLHDLAGRRLLLGPDAAELVAYLRSENVPYNEPRTHQSFDLKALIKGEVDAMPAYSTDEVFLLDKAGIPYSQFSPRSVGIDFYGDVLFTRDQEAQAHPERVRRFVEASLRGWHYALSHREEIARLIHARYSDRHTLEHLLFEAEHIRRLMTPELMEIGHMNPGRWRHIADIYAELGMMPAGFGVNDFLLPSKAEPPDNSRFYVILAVASAVAALAVWVSLYFFRLNKALHEEVRERQRLQVDLEHLANTDALTGLPTRRYFMEQLEREVTRRERYQHPLSLLILDLDHFKRVNDRWGHAVGDEALKAFAETVQCCLRTQDIAGRIGGEEFAVLLPETGEGVARPVAERIRQRMGQNVIACPNGESCRTTVSIGLAESLEGEAMGSLLRRADQALYAAKQTGRDRVVSVEEIQVTAVAPPAQE